jgi:hypothetical protein
MHLDVKIRPSNKFWARHLGGYRRNLVEVQQHTAFPVNVGNPQSGRRKTHLQSSHRSHLLSPQESDTRTLGLKRPF